MQILHNLNLKRYTTNKLHIYLANDLYLTKHDKLYFFMFTLFQIKLP